MNYDIDKLDIATGIIIATVAVAGIVWYYQPSITAQMNNQTSTASTITSSSAVQFPTVEFTFTVQDSKTPFAFVYNSQNNPTIHVKKGDVVNVTLINSGIQPHDFALEGYDVKTKVLTSGQSDSIVFTADKTGTFIYYCSAPGHRDLGMEGQFVVE
jgi:nitrite reductase (NO-forming)